MYLACTYIMKSVSNYTTTTYVSYLRRGWIVGWWGVWFGWACGVVGWVKFGAVWVGEGDISYLK